ncbi:MAG TPA: YdcF family protein [Xanthobacteraceae bacterium]|nr:YdcF family protein [Xanthobacteraceae bacterium]
MFFILSKMLGFFALPSDIAATLAALGVVLLFSRFRQIGRALATVGVVLLVVAGLSPLGNALMLPLEDRFPPWDPARGAPTGIVVLGGAIGPEISAARHTPDLNESAERITATAALARKYPAARIIYSGGNARLVLMGGIEADFAVDLFESLGIPRARIETERASRNTIENATFSKALARPKPGERWLLVTSAYHMPRAIGTFRRVGFAVEAYPVDWRTRGPIDLALPFESITAGLRRTDTAVHEWIGLVAYRLSGRTSELFPGP